MVSLNKEEHGGAANDRAASEEPPAGTCAETPPAALNAAFGAMRAAVRARPIPDIETRRTWLRALERILLLHEDEIAQSIAADFGGRSRHETALAEIFATVSAVRHNHRHAKRWATKDRAITALHLLPGRTRIIRRPLGVVGVVSPWNYPVHLALVPAAGALAAGNRVLLKPSELTPRTAALLRRLVADHFDPDVFRVVTGGAETGRAFSRLPFDHLFFTGSTEVGRRVAAAAAETRTPVTLELGGKSPAVVLGDADLSLTARRLAFGKFLNAGQTCVAPDYVLAAPETASRLAPLILRTVEERFGGDHGADDYSCIISQRHFDRLRALVEDAVARGAQRHQPVGFSGAQGRRFPPTLLTGVTPEMRVMQEEIFGPVLPIVALGEEDRFAAFIGERAHPLALYVFGKDKRAVDRLIAGTQSGGVTVNDTLWHMAQDDVPFGGVGESGMGAYHGERGFLTFSHQRAVFEQSRMAGTDLLHPPYGRTFSRIVSVLKRFA